MVRRTCANPWGCMERVASLAKSRKMPTKDFPFVVVGRHVSGRGAVHGGQPFNFTPMGVNLVSYGSLHVRPMACMW